MAIGGQKRHLTRLYEELASRLYGAGYPIEAREYKPHLTLARIPSSKTGARLASLVQSHSRILTESFPAEEIVLFESVKTPDGMRYEPLHKAKLQSATE